MTVYELLDLFPAHDERNIRIRDMIAKVHANLSFRAKVAAVSISGGSDSDVMLDVIQTLDPPANYPDSEVHYVWFDTGLEYTATKQHLDDLEAKYGITIERRRAKMPVPLGCKTYGLPFLSKQVSQYISRLQAHGFDFKKWGDSPFSFLLAMYPNCKAAIRWWCNEWGPDSQINICRTRLLKEFMVANPPDFPISAGCCKGAKKDVAHAYLREIRATINIVGVRQAEGGVRATAYNSCFSEPGRKGEAAQFRPLFYLTDEDKAHYCEVRGVTHSDLYAKYGFVRTGCACCPFGSRFEDELLMTAEIDPGLAKAARNIFDPAYEYTRAYRRFKAEHDARNKVDPNQTTLFEEATP